MTVRERVVLNCEEFRDREQDYKSHETNHIGLVRGKVLGYRVPSTFPPADARPGLSAAKSCLVVKGRIKALQNGLRCPSRESRRNPGEICGLRQHLLDHVAVDIGQTEVSPLVFEGQFGMVDAQQMQDCGV